jgi:hypothetical protein
MISMCRILRRQNATTYARVPPNPAWTKKVWAVAAVATLLATSASAQPLIKFVSAIPAAIRKFEPPSPIVRFHFLRSNCEEYHA